MEIKELLESAILMFNLTYNKKPVLEEHGNCLMLLHKTVNGGSLMIVRVFKDVSDNYCIMDGFNSEKGLIPLDELAECVIKTMEEHYQVWKHHV